MGSLVKSVYKTSIGKGGLSGLGITFGLTLVKYFLQVPAKALTQEAGKGEGSQFKKPDQGAFPAVLSRESLIAIL